jgi:hypothetical protein
MNVQMEDRLPGRRSIKLRYDDAIAPQSLYDGRAEFLDCAEEGSKPISGKVHEVPR